nr:hypothetical protein Iba_chr06aCG7410 [Ipomoea batatas]
MDQSWLEKQLRVVDDQLQLLMEEYANFWVKPSHNLFPNPANRRAMPNMSALVRRPRSMLQARATAPPTTRSLGMFLLVGLSEEPEVSASDMVRLISRERRSSVTGVDLLDSSPHALANAEFRDFPRYAHVLVVKEYHLAGSHLTVSLGSSCFVEKRLISAQ